MEAKQKIDNIITLWDAFELWGYDRGFDGGLYDYITTFYDISHLDKYLLEDKSYLHVNRHETIDILEKAIEAWQEDTVEKETTNLCSEIPEPSQFERDVTSITNEITLMLFSKNRKYGDAALNPTRIFSRSDSIEQLNVRIDDKINRIKNRQDDEDEDVISDLIGYLILLKIARKNKLTNNNK